MYFFMAACDASPTLGPNSLEWLPVQVGQRSRVFRQRSYSTEPLMSKRCPHKCLLDDNDEPIHNYGYYVRLRTDTPWRVPLLHCKCPSVPDTNAPAKEKGMYALFQMMLFRPHRLPMNLVKDIILRGAVFRGSEGGCFPMRSYTCARPPFAWTLSFQCLAPTHLLPTQLLFFESYRENKRFGMQSLLWRDFPIIDRMHVHLPPPSFSLP